MASNISWTDDTWSPVTGCTKVSQGCKNCYAEREVETRWNKNPKSVWYDRTFTDVQCHSDQLDKPLRMKNGKRIFVCPRADLFHDAVPDSFLDEIFAAMAQCPQHTFQVLTKRPLRMRQYIGTAFKYKEPLKNLHLGVSIEDQPSCDERLGHLLATKAWVRWISAEPLLGYIHFGFPSGARVPEKPEGFDSLSQERKDEIINGMARATYMARCGIGIDWVVVGGESGPTARPMHPNWIRDLRDQCISTGVPFNFKHWGEWLPADQDECPCGPPFKDWMWADGKVFSKNDNRDMPLFRRVGKRFSGRLLDGVLHDQYPAIMGEQS